MDVFAITQDASASAYQIMSFFLLDVVLAKRKNIIPSDDDEEKVKIQDVYAYMLEAKSSSHTSF
jgi:hypothetical protein